MDSTFIIEEPLREEGVGVGLACSLENFTSSPLFSINKFHCSLKSFAKIPFNCRDIPCSLKLSPKYMIMSGLVSQDPWQALSMQALRIDTKMLRC